MLVSSAANYGCSPEPSSPDPSPLLSSTEGHGGSPGRPTRCTSGGLLRARETLAGLLLIWEGPFDYISRITCPVIAAYGAFRSPKPDRSARSRSSFRGLGFLSERHR